MATYSTPGASPPGRLSPKPQAPVAGILVDVYGLEFRLTLPLLASSPFTPAYLHLSELG
ncbi:hypothetical protein E4U41_005079 [Claviceps citrina]|nr:hypothetical protein E4U41_005079 [Claviceps citrina]